MTRALEGIRVLDFSRVLAGPFCSMALADLGADVIKVERPGGGDDLRAWGPPFMPDGESTYFLSVNRNKRSILVDLKNEKGREIACKLSERCDVVLENFRPGVMESLGLGYEQLRQSNPGLIYCAINGYGRAGPMKERPGYDGIIQGMAGLMSVTGEPDGSPVRVGVAIADLVTGLYSAVGILAALQSRTINGHGQRVDLSLLESCLSVMPNLTAGYLMAGTKPARYGNSHSNAVPYGTFATKDGNFILTVGNDRQWQHLCAALDRPDLAEKSEYATNEARVVRRDELDKILSSIFRERTTDEWVRDLEKAEVPCGPIYTIDRILSDPQIEALEIVKTLSHPTSGDLRFIGAPFQFSADDTDPYRSPPCVGEHGQSVLEEILSISPAEFDKLVREGAVAAGVADRSDSQNSSSQAAGPRHRTQRKGNR